MDDHPFDKELCGDVDAFPSSDVRPQVDSTHSQLKIQNSIYINSQAGKRENSVLKLPAASCGECARSWIQSSMFKVQ